jgi:hypothetical protein
MTCTPQATNRICINPRDQIAAAIANSPTDVDEGRSGEPIAPSLQCANGEAKEIGCLLLAQECIGVLI